VEHIFLLHELYQKVVKLASISAFFFFFLCYSYVIPFFSTLWFAFSLVRQLFGVLALDFGFSTILEDAFFYWLHLTYRLLHVYFFFFFYRNSFWFECLCLPSCWILFFCSCFFFLFWFFSWPCSAVIWTLTSLRSLKFPWQGLSRRR